MKGARAHYFVCIYLLVLTKRHSSAFFIQQRGGVFLPTKTSTIGRVPTALRATNFNSNGTTTIGENNNEENDTLVPILKVSDAATAREYPLLRPPSLKSQWQRAAIRLNTMEDPLKLHKISAVVWTLSGLYILGTGMLNACSEIPPSLLVPSWLFVLAGLVQSISSISMAIEYRKNDPIVQRGFFNSAVTVTSAAYYALYVSPFAPSILNEFVVGNGIAILLSLPSVIFGLDEVCNLSHKIDHRAIRNKEKSKNLGKLADLLSYGIVALFGFLGSLAAVIFAAIPTHDRLWFINHAEESPWLSDHFVTDNYYLTVGTGMAAGIGALAITLRDKKLINREQEQVLVSVFTIPSFLLFLHAFKIIS